MPRLDFICISPLYSSLARICMTNNSGSMLDKINYVHSISLSVYTYIYTHTTPHVDRFPFNSRYRKEANTIFIITLPKRLCS